MRRFVNGLELIRDMDQFLKNSLADAYEGHEMLATQSLADWKELTSGTLTPDVTAGAFARGIAPSQSTPKGARRQLSKYQLKDRGVRHQAPLLPINMQSHRLYDSIKKRRVSGGGARQAFDAGPTASAGRSLYVIAPAGTKKMVSRQIWPVIEKRWKARNKALADYMKQRTESR